MSQRNDVAKILCSYPGTFANDESLISHEKILSVFCKPYSPVSFGPDRTLFHQLDGFNPEIIFIPMERYLRFRGVPVVNMVQNMMPLIYPSGISIKEGLRNFARKNVARRAVLNSQRTIAVSHYVQEFLVGKWHIPQNLVPVIYFGADTFDNIKAVRPNSIFPEWDRFLFTAGSIEPFRGLEDILTALQALHAQAKKIPLVVAGEARPEMATYKHRITARILSKEVNKQVCWAGLLKPAEMAWCYQNCSAFLMASRVEACPNVALEAMSHGAVCIAADTPVLKEFFADSAVYYRSGQGQLLAGLIENCLTLDPGERQMLVKRGRQRSEMFSWDKTVDRTMEELKKVLR